MLLRVVANTKIPMELTMPVEASKPRVSVGMPVYNGKAFLAQSIESVLGQTYANLELIVSDNGSTDGTPEIAQDYARRDRRVRFVRTEENRGAAWNYRRTFDLARGEFFRWAPADDLFAPDSIAVCVAALDADPDAVLCYPKTELIDPEGRVIRGYDDNLDLRASDPAERLARAMAQIGLVNVIYGLMRTAALGKTRLMGTFVGADEVLVFELALQGKFLELPTSRFYRRIHENAFSQMATTEQKQAFFDPRKTGRFSPRLWEHYRQCLHGVVHAPISAAAKWRAIGVLVRSAIAVRRDLMREVAAGARRAARPKLFGL
ncbi:MAG TPA: glycosyltransferase family 2 protein [Candidatus Krumholzibacteria bacterium]|nr:glycosyltransferase family 2 protein [Candidatus Krumholzibacteria bacterium]